MFYSNVKGSSIPALRRPEGGLVVAPAEKAPLPGSQFDSIKQCREQYVTPLSVCLSLGEILWPCGLLSFFVRFLILTHMVVLTLWVCFLYF